VLALVGLFVYLRVASDLSSAIDVGLRSRAIDLTAAVSGAAGEEPLLRVGQGEEETFSQVLTPNGEVVASTLAPGVGSTLAPGELREAAAAPLLIDGVEVPGIEGKARVLARPASSSAGELVVVAGATTEDRDETLAGLAGAFAIGAPVALLLAIGLGYLLASRALAPVEAMRRRAGAITLERRGERLPLPRAEDEIKELGRTLNTMLDRIEASLERERVFVADASHELRTPLAILRAELELADRPGRSAEELRAAVGSAGEEVERLSRLAEDLLVIARSDQGRLPIARKSVDVADLLARVQERFSRRARERDRKILVDAPAGLQTELDPMRVEQALGNLTDNALRHGRGDVKLTARRDDGFAVLEVSDQGSGFPAEFEGQAFERFTRADPGRTGGGAGLGLAITRAIAVAHDGDVAIVAGPGNETTLRVKLPLG
jgi:signal transduction histidine kinase